MEDKATIENLKKEVAKATEAIQSGTADLEKVVLTIDNAELIAETFVLQFHIDNRNAAIACSWRF